MRRLLFLFWNAPPSPPLDVQCPHVALLLIVDRVSSGVELLSLEFTKTSSFFYPYAHNNT